MSTLTAVIAASRPYCLLCGLAEAMRAYAARRRAVAELSALTDRELADVGLSRCDIDRVAAGTYRRGE